MLGFAYKTQLLLAMLFHHLIVFKSMKNKLVSTVRYLEVEIIQHFFLVSKAISATLYHSSRSSLSILVLYYGHSLLDHLERIYNC
jgi:hypothetical protein